jgi:hypothetical protein
MEGTPDTRSWYISDKTDFQSGIDKTETHSGIESVYLKSVVPRPKEFGFISKSIQPEPYCGKRLKFTAWVKTSLAEGASVQLWLRVDGDWKQRAGCFDNMYKRRIKGNTDWSHFEVEVEVPDTSKQIVYGALLNGTGQLWLDDMSLEAIEAVT